MVLFLAFSVPISTANAFGKPVHVTWQNLRDGHKDSTAVAEVGQIDCIARRSAISAPTLKISVDVVPCGGDHVSGFGGADRQSSAVKPEKRVFQAIVSDQA
jgi:hypothetical protein